MKRWVIALLVIIFLGIGGFWFWQKSFKVKIPSGWQVYQAEKGGFQIAYPADWKKEAEEGRVRFFDPTKDFFWFQIWFGPTVAHGEEFGWKKKTEKIKIAGIPAEKNLLVIDKNLFLEERSEEEYEQVKDNKMIYSLVKRKGQEYWFELVYQQSEEEELFDQFIQSFRFR